MPKVAPDTYAKLLDAWVAPREVGNPVGCAATSFTFSPAFFEEECLARFLDLESDPREDGPIYLIEREEKLAKVLCAAALVDAQHCQGRRSLRWDLLPVRVPRGVLHAKLSLLCWQQRIRLIVASANLTDDGYRRNQETFGVLDYFEGSAAPQEALVEVLGFLQEAAVLAGESASPALERWHSLLAWAEARLNDWEEAPMRQSGVRIQPVLISPERPSALEQLRALWPGQRPPNEAQIVSPFFDPPDSPHNAPAVALWQLLRRKGSAEITYHITAEKTPESNLLLHAPKSLDAATPANRPGVQTHFAWVAESGLEAQETVAFRPLHAKQVWLDNGNWVGAMIGSSNFTSPGLGLGKTTNLEANLVYFSDRRRQPKLVKALEAGQLRGTPIDDQIRYWQPREDETLETDTGPPELPGAFGAAILRADEPDGLTIELNFTAVPPRGWTVYPEDQTKPFYTEAQWQASDCPKQIALPWRDTTLPPTGLEVSWSDAQARAWWPINIVDANVLPPPENLRSLSLEALIHILTTARPLKEAMRSWMTKACKRQQMETNGAGEEFDPHKRVDVSGFLIQRTRQVSWALNGLRERLERPVPTHQALRWRLDGPVGVRQVAYALEREQHSQEEYAFLLAELLMELIRVQPNEAPGCLSAAEVRTELACFIGEMRPKVEAEAVNAPDSLQDYILGVLEQVSRQVEVI